MLFAHQILVNNWELTGQILLKHFPLGFTGCQVKGKLAQHWINFTAQEGMLLIQFNINLGLSTTEKLDNCITVFIGLLPCIHIMKNIVIGKLKPLDLLGIHAASFHYSISGGFGFIIVEDKLALHDKIGSQLHWEVWEDGVVFGDCEVVDHSGVGDGDVDARSTFSILVEDGEVDAWGFAGANVVAEGE